LRSATAHAPGYRRLYSIKGSTVPAYKYGLSRPFGSKRRPQASTTKDLLTRIPPVVRCSAYQRNTGVAMAANEKTFGGAISEARKAKGWALKDLASRVLREDEEAISPQYLNDIEHDRRSPSSDRMVQQFADALGIDRDWLYYLAGRFPEDVRNKKLSEKQVAEAMVAFRSSPRKGKGRS
jgi:transcriptional regulator with XRE-family HTH domain